MDANKFWETKRKICNTYDSCSDGCPLYSRDSGQSCLGTTTNIKKEVDIMEQWLKENGERTFFSFDFSEPSIALAVIGNIHDNPELMEAENNEK